MDRKAFIHKTVRGSILLVFVGLTAFFYRSGKISPLGECKVDNNCARCRELKRCTLPQAQTQREND